ncbi:MAG: hypothetical protein KAU50_02070 [Candidatus Marinimicrobia bacterium]|nr:hypothetical protein [Candidatus Neomarinimicrobiota bacterium]
MAWKSVRLLLASLLMGSCGMYSFRGNLPVHIESVAIATVINQTSEYLLTDMAYDLVTDLFIRENVLRVGDSESADSELQLTVTRVTDKPATYDVEEIVEEWRIDIHLQVVWYDIARNRPLFEKKFSSFTHYPPGGDIGSDGVDNDGDGEIDESDEFGDPREFALRIALDQISTDILNEVLSTW